MIKVTKDNIVSILNNLPLVIGRHFENNTVYIIGRLTFERNALNWSINYKSYDNDYIFNYVYFRSFDEALEYIVNCINNPEFKHNIIV